ncbi:protein indeterminate-domain 7-like [Trifolium pratense]|uniref:protein indeterminate-domain 7-like n=1 Tax=Trifolium pratense TaxID=57577 RepID=UPI001E696980|nr:protein indeterminate-domain 7-like [Trifolium pratense]
MMKGLSVDENMSNLTSVSSEISPSNSATKNGKASTNLEPQTKRKRNLPGHPDPEAEVIALSPQTLLATNRFICEICNKGFQRDQNLQLHKRGHNLPWKLKKRNSKEIIRKKVYVCPESTCVHHEPSRALGDLTGIKKHFFRKHGEKKWKCEKCSKRYAVQSDWKAHSKICGTKEYKCDCGTLFSRRDSFITHRAFCDVLSQESAALNPLFSSHSFQLPSLKKEQDFNIIRPEIIPSWFPSSSTPQQLLPTHFSHYHQNPNPTNLFHSNFNSNNIITTSSPHMSATALLQKASQIGVTVSKTEPCIPHLMQTHVPYMTSRDHEIVNSTAGFSHYLASYGNKAVTNTEESSLLLHDVIFGNENSSSHSSQFESVNAAMSMRGMFDPQIDNNNFQSQQYSNFGKSNIIKSGGAIVNDDEMTRDFLSLGAFSQRDDLLFSISGIDDPLGSLSYGKQNQNQTPWRRG